MTETTDCVFCKIVAGEMPAKTVGETERTLGFRDINPQAPTHVLVIPKTHHDTAAAMAAADGELFGELIEHAHRIAADDGIADSGYRLVFNTGDEGGQTVHHVHCHLLGGRVMTWPPG
ncbi:histidine triad nucleotide-binding protein [Haloactinomyces albus]|uniref:Histidine triad (HIT) family protein n=1 Tax=Haloactinomyces albus TaxID=1352928 RepID=A0AAE3ZFH7_9ACTN|nr:histidine triad nucleotide-binding protein [Haloactinomyces albus]MDR7302926.1 histidine triad (HIT) family protein [Haloactinomyces albus]